MAKPKSKKGWVSLFTFIVVIAFYLYLLPPVEQASETPSPSTPSTETVNPGDTWYELYFTSPVIPFDDVTTGGIEENLINKIDQSTTSIDLAVYEFDLENVAQALIRAHNRGVKVRVVYDDEFSDPDPQMSELIDAGINAVPDKRSAYMHNKFFVFDHQCIWTGSFNISVNAAYRNNENALYFCSQEASANYTQEFNEMFAGNFGASSPSDTPYPIVMIGDIKIEIYFAPEDDVMDKVIRAVAKAQKSIHFMAFSFTSDSLGQEMITIQSKGTGVSGVFETRGASSEYSQCSVLLRNGAEISLDGNPRTLHHKVIIIDSKVVILGSFNFTNSADKENDENLLIIYDESLAKLYENEFQKIKEQSIIPSGDICEIK